MKMDFFVKYRGLLALVTLLTLTAPAAAQVANSGSQEVPFTRQLSESFGDFHDIVSHSAFVNTLMSGKMTKSQVELHFQQRALVHNELHRILNKAAEEGKVPYEAPQKNVLVLLFNDLIAMGSGWPTEAQAEPKTEAFLKELQASEKRGPYFALGVQHVYYGGITNGGRMIGKVIEESTKVTPNYYLKSDGYRDYLAKINAMITDPEARKEMIRGGRAAYEYIIATNNDDAFKTK